VLNGQGLGCHPLGVSYLDMDTVLNEQGLGRCILSDALHRCSCVVKNEQGSSHWTLRMQRIRKLAEPRRLYVCSWNVGSLMGKFQEIVDTMIRQCVNILCLDCKLIPRECVVPQHKLVVAVFCFWVRIQWSKHVKVPRTKWWKLKEE
jgi:hypothetical protein